MGRKDGQPHNGLRTSGDDKGTDDQTLRFLRCATDHEIHTQVSARNIQQATLNGTQGIQTGGKSSGEETGTVEKESVWELNGG